MTKRARVLIGTLACVFSGCAHRGGSPFAPVILRDELRITGLASPLIEQPRPPYEPDSLSTFGVTGGPTLKILKTEDVSASTAVEKIKIRQAELERLFQRSVEPYFGTVHDYSHCMDPRELKKEEIHLFATERFVLMGCREDDSVYRTRLVFLFCERRKTFYEIRLYEKLVGVTSQIRFDCL